MIHEFKLLDNNNFEFGAIQRNFPENGAKMTLKLLPNLVEKLISKFQEEILKNVGGVAILVTEIKQKAQMEIQLIM